MKHLRFLLMSIVLTCSPLTAFANSATTEATQAIAAGSSNQSPSTKLINLVYYPHRNRFLIGDYLQSSATSNSTVSDDSGDLSDSVLTFTRIGANAEYGITDHFRLGISLNQLVEQDNLSINDTDGTANDHVSRGLSDPQINLAYRTFENQRLGLYSDIVATTQTSFGPQVTSTGNQAGNNKTGAWSEQIAVPAYWLLAIHEFEIAPSLTRNFGARISGANNKTTGSDDTFWTWSILLRDRMHITDVFFLEPTLTADMRNGYDFNSHSGSSHHVEIPVRLLPEISLGYIITPWCLLNLVIAYENYEQRTTSMGGAVRNDDISETNFAIHTTFIF